MRRKGSYQSSGRQGYTDDTARMLAAAPDASPVAEVKCLVP